MLSNKVREKNWPRGLNREILLLGIISLLADISGEMLTPVMPIFLTSVLGASAANVGWVEGLAEAVASILKTFSGRWSDNIGRRRPFIVVGYLIAAVAKLATGLAQTWMQVLLARVLDRFGKGIRGAPRDALIADAVDASERARAFGWHRALDTVGAIIGPLAALGLLAVTGANLRRVFVAASIPGLLAVLLTFLIREPRRAPGVQLSESLRNGQRIPRAGALREKPYFARFLSVWVVFCIGNSSDAFLILRAKSIGCSTQQTIFIYCMYNFVYAATSPWLGGLADTLGKKRVLCSGLCVFSIVYLGFGWADQIWHIAFFYSVYGLFSAATEGVGRSLAVDLLPVSRRGYGLGLLGTVTGICTLLASVIAGQLWDGFGPSSVFIFGAVLAACAALALFSLNLDAGTPRETPENAAF